MNNAGTLAPESPKSGPPASLSFWAAAAYSSQVAGGVILYFSNTSVR